MKITGSHRLPVPPDKAVAALLDPVVLQQSIPGCEQVEKTSEDEFEARLKLGLAAIKGEYRGKIRLADKNLPQSFTLQLEGKGGPGFVKGSSRIKLEAIENGAELSYESEVQVGGLIAAIGSRMIEVIGRKLAEDFFKRFSAAISQPKQVGSQTCPPAKKAKG